MQDVLKLLPEGLLDETVDDKVDGAVEHDEQVGEADHDVEVDGHVVLAASVAEDEVVLRQAVPRAVGGDVTLQGEGYATCIVLMTHLRS